MTANTLKSVEHWIIGAFRLLIALELFALMLLTCADVTGRYFFNRPVYGGLEVTEIILAAVIFTSLPLVTWHGEQVIIDMVTLPGRMVRLVQHVAGHLIGAVALAVLSRQLWLRGDRLDRAGETTMQVQIPMSLVAYAISVLLAVTALAFLIRAAIPDAYVSQSSPGADRD